MFPFFLFLLLLLLLFGRSEGGAGGGGAGGGGGLFTGSGVLRTQKVRSSSVENPGMPTADRLKPGVSLACIRRLSRTFALMISTFQVHSTSFCFSKLSSP